MAVSAVPPGRGSGRQMAINVVAGGGGNIIKVALQLVMLPLMARLLGPAEFGIYGLALPTVSFFMILADAGLGVSLARERGYNPVLWSTAFWLMLLVGVSLAIVVAGWGVVLAQVSGEPRILPVMTTLSFSLLFLTATVLPMARIIQQGRLVILSLSDVVSAMVGSVVAVTLAWKGAGAMSLALQYVTVFLTRAVILNAVSFVRPTFTFRLAALKDHISTGTSIIASRLADFSGRLAENLIYGRAYGVAALGTFTFANQVPRFLGEAASNPIWSALYAHSVQDQNGGASNAHAKLVYILTLVLAPAAFILCAATPLLISLTLGPKWHDASLLLQVLTPFYILNVISSQSGAILIARGKGWVLFWITMVLVVGRIGAIALGVEISTLAVALSIGAVHVVFSSLMLIVPGRQGLIAVGSVARSLVGPLAAGALAGLLCWWILDTMPPTLLSAVLAVGGSVAAYGVLVLLFDGSRVIAEGNAIMRILLKNR
jgi:PST family polysaccharide transporter